MNFLEGLEVIIKIQAILEKHKFILVLTEDLFPHLQSV
jgi:hypothetical protein